MPDPRAEAAASMTPTSQKLVELAERVERATVPHRELDEAIADAAYRYNCRNPIWDCGEVAHYTASLDAAMTLADKICVIVHMSDIGAAGLPLVQLGEPSTMPVSEWIGIAASLPLAFTAAALRARAAQEPDHAQR